MAAPAGNSTINRQAGQVKQANSYGFPASGSQSTRVTRMAAPRKDNGKVKSPRG